MKLIALIVCFSVFFQVISIAFSYPIFDIFFLKSEFTLNRLIDSDISMASLGFLKIIAALATCWKSPLDILKKIDDVLIAVDKRLIIFLEDVDRNKNDEVFFNEIAALLDSLRQLSRVSFVLAIGQKYDAEEILIKTAEHVENVPRLRQLDVLNTLNTFRIYCIAICPETISTTSKNHDRDRMGWDRLENILHLPNWVSDSFEPIDVISELTDNPRVLKHALRRTLTLWKKLAGEIDFDDLLIVNVLKVVDERIFSFIDKNIIQLCELVACENRERESELRNELEPEYTRATKGDKYDTDTVRKLINTLFPGFAGGDISEFMTRQLLTSYQHVANDEPTRYWERIKRGELYDNEVADCEILEALTKWNADFESKAFRDMEMIKALSKDKAVFEKARQFKGLISQVCLQKAASKQFDMTLKEHRNKANCEVCDAVGQWFMLKPEHNDEQWQQWLLEEIKKALPVSLRYVNDLYCSWYNPEQNLDLGLRAQVVEAAKDIFENNPALLAKVLDPDYIWSVFDFSLNFAEKDKGTNILHQSQWKWLGGVLLEAGKNNPQVIGPQIANIFYKILNLNREKNIEFNDKFDHSVLKSIFSNQEEKVMKLLLLQGVDIEKYDEQSKAVLFRARDEATEWLKQKHN